ncbi:hypothetical protein MUK42_04996 [Musa troglodytarum]|uniref:Uncharacterized protein n=1 Tax=Musa troglodytarum TaxID=320322 RepID=A0A9E7I6A1_9LILI|nr:hypothetical protein MUK42_04996 [Musa troglodytarum]
MPHRTRPMTSLLVFMGLNLVLVNTLSPVYDFVCFLPYWERRRTGFFRQRTVILMACGRVIVIVADVRERRRKEREAASGLDAPARYFLARARTLVSKCDDVMRDPGNLVYNE